MKNLDTVDLKKIADRKQVILNVLAGKEEFIPALAGEYKEMFAGQSMAVIISGVEKEITNVESDLKKYIPDSLERKEWLKQLTPTCIKVIRAINVPHDELLTQLLKG